MSASSNLIGVSPDSKRKEQTRMSHGFILALRPFAATAFSRTPLRSATLELAVQGLKGDILFRTFETK